jgi:hypothetical protein
MGVWKKWTSVDFLLLDTWYHGINILNLQSQSATYFFLACNVQIQFTMWPLFKCLSLRNIISIYEVSLTQLFSRQLCDASQSRSSLGKFTCFLWSITGWLVADGQDCLLFEPPSYPQHRCRVNQAVTGAAGLGGPEPEHRSFKGLQDLFGSLSPIPPLLVIWLTSRPDTTLIPHCRTPGPSYSALTRSWGILLMTFLLKLWWLTLIPSKSSSHFSSPSDMAK